MAETSRSRSRTCRDVVYWHCGRRGHMRQRCFRRMRQHKKRMLRDSHMADSSKAQVVLDTERCFCRMRQHKKRMLCDSHMADSSTAQVVLDTTTINPCALFQRFLLDMSAVSMRSHIESGLARIQL